MPKLIFRKKVAQSPSTRRVYELVGWKDVPNLETVPQDYFKKPLYFGELAEELVNDSDEESSEQKVNDTRTFAYLLFDSGQEKEARRKAWSMLGDPALFSFERRLDIGDTIEAENFESFMKAIHEAWDYYNEVLRDIEEKEKDWNGEVYIEL